MKISLLEVLRCPRCGGELVIAGESQAVEVEWSLLRCRLCNGSYPIKQAIPRFVMEEDSTQAFGFQWNRFRRTQLDSYSKTTISHDRFFRQTGWDPAELQGKRILDVGCGAGRFAEVSLSCGAEVIAVDSSLAVDACWDNLRHYPSLHVVQADIYALPFAPASFDYVYCFGVLQHTPNVQHAFAVLPDQLREGGRIAVDVYPKIALNYLWPKYWLRPLSRRLPSRWLYLMVRLMVSTLLPFSRWVARMPLLGRRLRHIVPVANYDGVYPLSRQQQYEWALLDTFDMLAPAYDQPQAPDALASWMKEAGLVDITVFRAGHLVGRGRRSEREERV